MQESELQRALIAWDDWSWEKGMLAVDPSGRKWRITSVVGWSGPTGYDDEADRFIDLDPLCVPVIDDPATEGWIDHKLRMRYGDEVTVYPPDNQRHSHRVDLRWKLRSSGDFGAMVDVAAGATRMEAKVKALTAPRAIVKIRKSFTREFIPTRNWTR